MWEHAKPKGKWKEVSKEKKKLDTKVARRVQREKPNSAQWSKVKNKKKEIDVGSETTSWKYEKGKMKRTKQDASLRRNATLMLPKMKS